jgi:uncharacterized protein YfaS (alpha-2-macroglobulin family)
MHKSLRATFFVGTFVLLLGLAACVPEIENFFRTPVPTASATTSAPTLSVAVNQGQNNQDPTILAQNPLPGERIPLRPIIRLTFDRAMDKKATAAAWTFSDSENTPLPGAGSWLDERTFLYVVGENLEADSTYWGTFSTSAADTRGKTLNESIRIKFQTLSALVVGEVLPGAGANDVDTSTSITVVFNKPVVPVKVTEDQASLPQPLEFTPAVKGSGEWVNSSVYIFTPDEVLESDQTYSLHIPAGLKDSSGMTLAEDFTWDFTTRAVSGSVRGENFDNIFLDQAIIVDFAQPMDPESVKQGLTLTDRKYHLPFPIKLEWAPDFTWVSITPSPKYQIASFYTLNISDQARAKTGGSLETPIHLEFSTLPLPSIESVTPNPDIQPKGFNPWLTIQFSSPMDLDSLKGRVKIQPEPETTPISNYDSYQRMLMISGLEPGTEYLVTVLPGMKDIYGNMITSEYSFSFRTADLSPHAALLMPSFPLVYQSSDPQQVYFEYTNIDSAEIAIYPITFEQLTFVLDPDLGQTEFVPAVAPVRDWKPDLQGSKNRTVRLSLDFTSENGSNLLPGYYFIGLKAEPFDYKGAYLQSGVFMVSTDSLTLKTSPSEALVWLTNLQTGAPTGGVSVIFYNDRFSEIGRATTDGNGMAYLPNIKNAWYARTEDNKHSAFVSQDWGSGVSTGQFGLWWNYYTNYSTRFAYVYTERPLYRPGQDVYITGIVRRNDDLHYSLPGDASIYLTINYYDEQVFSQTVPLDDQGGFSVTFSLDDAAALGSYDVKILTSPGDTQDPFGQVSFRVAEYHKPEFQVQTSIDKPEVLVGEHYTVNLDASYYSGGTVGEAAVHWYTDSSPYYFQASPDYSGYSFSDWDRDAYWSDPQLQTPAVTEEGDAQLDTDGHVSLDQTASLGNNSTSRQVQFYANVTDSSGNIVGTHTSLVVHQSSMYAGIRSGEYIGEANQEQTFHLVVLDWNSQPVANQKVSVDIVNRQWYSVQEQDAQGQVSWVTSVKDVPVTHFEDVQTDSNGEASVSFTPGEGGIYKATVIVQDAKLHSQQSSTYLWVSGGEYIPWKQTNDRSFSLVADKDSYSPGDTAEILIASPFEGKTYALVTVERGHIYSREVIPLEGNSSIYKLEITPEMTPATYVSVLVVSGSTNTGKADFKVGLVRLNVDTSLQTLDVSISTDKPSAGPGDQVTYTVTTRDSTGKPVEAEVSLSLVDKAILALAPANSLPIVNAFYPVRALNIVTSVGIVMNAEDFNANFAETAPEGDHSGGGGGKGVGDEGIINVREDFRDTAFYQGQIKTDSTGKAQVTITLPENLTTWVMEARAATADSIVGQATNELISSKPMFVQLQTARFFTTGDTTRIGATVFNNTTQPLNVTVTLSAEGGTIVDDPEQTISVEGGRQGYLTWDLQVAQDATQVNLVATAKAGTYEDSSTPPLATLAGGGIPVQGYRVTEAVGTSGVLNQADSVSESVQLPPNLASQDASLSVLISPSLTASLLDGLSALEVYEYSGMEQTTSRLLANLMTKRIMTAAKLSDAELQGKLEKQINAALQHIFGAQNYDGGWGWWNTESEALTSAYVLYGLNEAKNAGYDIPETVWDNALQYLKDNLQVLNEESANWQYNRQAFMVYVLVKAGDAQPGNISRLYKSRDKLAVYGKAYLLLAINLQDSTDTRIDTLKADLATSAVVSAAGTHWEETTADVWNWGSDLRTSAVVLNALIQIDPQDPLTTNAVRWLVSRRSVTMWGSSQETAWTLTALTNWLITTNEYEANYPYLVGMNGKVIRDGTASTDNIGETVSLEVAAAEMVKNGINTLVITRGDGPGNLYYSAYLNASLPVPEIEPLDQGITVLREYFSLTDDKTPITEIQRGEVVRVRITVIAPDSLHYVLVKDPLPAGMEPIDNSLMTDMQVPNAYSIQDYRLRGWGWWFFSHVELHDDRVTLSANYLPAGTYVYTYLARASSVGMYSVIPTTAEELYFPDVAGRGAGSEFVVNP